MADSLQHPVHSELLIKKSRFIGCVQAVPDRQAAKQVVAALWAEHPNAAHICWALLAGGQSAAVDDGEPSGTAGRPMLDVLRHQNLEGVLATVVRYFGGVKLGAGGLVGAYTDCVAQALKHAVRVPIVKRHRVRCEAPYALEGLIRRTLSGLDAELLEVQHQSTVILTIWVAESAHVELVNALQESGQGKIIWLND